MVKYTLPFASGRIPRGMAAAGACAGGVPAFPGAEGFGAGTPGGRGGAVLFVTNLNDSGAGSLREAMTASGPRIVLFKVAGTISLRSDLTVTQPFLTVAGQTAPGEGVQVRDAQIKISTHDVIIRYLKVRSGDAPSSSLAADRDAVALNHDTNAYNIVVDHSTLIWGSDVGGITFLNGTHDATVSYSILGEGLYVSNHPEGVLNQGGHSMTMNITELSSSNHPTRITVHHNLFANASDRNPRIIGGELIDMINNVVFNWKDSPTQGNPRSLNLINNFYIKGPMSTNNNALVAFLPKVESGGAQRSGTVFESGNRTEGFTTVRGNPASVFTSTRFPTSINNPDSPEIAYDRIVADAGANRQVAGSNGSFVAIRDSVDARIINDLVDRTGTFVNGLTYGGVAGYPAIKYPTLATGTAAADSDNDGMPDDWEQKYFGNTSRGSESNSSGDMDGDGYTDVEEYINATDPTK